ncbi:MAG: NTP transferase domain-containing protein [Methanolinea sp.]
MYALILAGGEGSRLGLGEKPLVSVGGIPMIRRVTDAFLRAGCEVVAVLSPRTPYTHNWCRANGIPHYTAAGKGYVEDLVEAVTAMEISSPVFTCVTDLPFISADIVADLAGIYAGCGKDALSAWVPKDLADEYCFHAPCVEVVSGVEACPAGVNILRGDAISVPQDELRVLFRDPRLACHVNTRDALERANRFVPTSFP